MNELESERYSHLQNFLNQLDWLGLAHQSFWPRLEFSTIFLAWRFELQISIGPTTGRDSMLSKPGCKLTDRIFQGWAHIKTMRTPMEPCLVGIPLQFCRPFLPNSTRNDWIHRNYTHSKLRPRSRATPFVLTWDPRHSPITRPGVARPLKKPPRTGKSSIDQKENVVGQGAIITFALASYLSYCGVAHNFRQYDEIESIMLSIPSSCKRNFTHAHLSRLSPLLLWQPFKKVTSIAYLFFWKFLYNQFCFRCFSVVSAIFSFFLPLLFSLIMPSC